MALSVVFNLLVPDHDAGVFQWVETPSGQNATVADAFVSAITAGLERWDGQYFLHIANNGYTYENCLAFFPLYPMLLRWTGHVLYWLQVDYGVLSMTSALRLAVLVLNTACFVGASLFLYELTRKALRDEYLAYKSALFFTFNPASIFFSAAYSESLHSLLSFYVMLKTEHGFSVSLVLALGLSTATRSNAILNIGFVAYKALWQIFRELAIHFRLKQLERADFSETLANLLGDSVVPGCATVLGGLVPFALFQWFAFTQFCGLTKLKMDLDEAVASYAQSSDLRLPSMEPPEWCHHSLPLAYSSVQERYWDVGFLRYFQLKQAPNFLLAAPILMLTFGQAKRFFQHHSFYARRVGFTYFGLDPAQRVPSPDVFLSGVLPKECFVYFVHAVALALTCTFFAHVQIATRMLCSSSPVLYWTAALLTTSRDKRPTPLMDLNKDEMVAKLESKENLDSWWNNVIVTEAKSFKTGKEIIGYFLGYTALGTLLFANFLPWT